MDQFFPLHDSSTLLPVTTYKADPDIVVGHEFLGVSLDVLLKRMRDLKADHWSRIGRFRRSKWPNIGRQGTNLKFMTGRLMCDLASDSAKVRPPLQFRLVVGSSHVIPGYDLIDNMVAHGDVQDASQE